MRDFTCVEEARSCVEEAPPAFHISVRANGPVAAAPRQKWKFSPVRTIWTVVSAVPLSGFKSPGC
jgi:hypothetical protein